MKKQNFFLAHKQFTVFFILALAVVGVAVFAPWIAPKDPLDAVMVDSLKAPCAEYPLGADKLGRDILSRVIYGTRTSLVSTLILVAIYFCCRYTAWNYCRILRRLDRSGDHANRRYDDLFPWNDPGNRNRRYAWPKP